MLFLKCSARSVAVYSINGKYASVLRGQDKSDGGGVIWGFNRLERNRRIPYRLRDKHARWGTMAEC